MKKVRFVLIAMAMVAFALFATVSKATADCPNGCLGAGDGCWCHTWYPCLLEASGGGGQAIQ